MEISLVALLNCSNDSARKQMHGCIQIGDQLEYFRRGLEMLVGLVVARQ